jgi:hypothetical protein
MQFCSEGSLEKECEECEPEAHIMAHEDDAFISDLESRLTDLEIMEKYRISAAELRKDLFTLIRKAAVSSRKVYWRPIIYDYDAEYEVRRSTPRYPLKKLLPVSSVDYPQPIPALLIDINEKGGCVVGLGVQKGERITIAIDPGDLLEADAIRLEALFRWVEKGDDPDILAAGFEIFAISDEDFALLKELIRTIVVKI